MPSESNLALIAKLTGHDSRLPEGLCLRRRAAGDPRLPGHPQLRRFGHLAGRDGLSQGSLSASGRPMFRECATSRPRSSNGSCRRGRSSSMAAAISATSGLPIRSFRERVLERFPRPSDHPVSAVDSLQVAGTRGSERADHRASQEFRAARARRGIEAVRGEALRLPGAALPGHGLLHRRAPAVPRPRFPVLAMLRADLEKAGDADRSAYPDIPMEDWITESAHARARRQGARRGVGAACAQAGRDRGCASSTRRRTTASGAASGRSRAGARSSPIACTSTSARCCSGGRMPCSTTATARSGDS